MSKIEWTDETWNPLVGCTIVSPGCTNCYAMKMAWRLQRIAEAHAAAHGGDPGPMGHYLGTVKLVNGNPVWTGKINPAPESTLTKPLRWTRPRLVFVNSMSDLFHEEVPSLLIDQIFAVMAAAPQHTFQVLTKRPHRLRQYAREAMGCGEHWLAHVERSHAPTWPLPNVWLGVSTEDQKRADERIPILLDTPAAVRWISAEPLLGPISLFDFQDECPTAEEYGIIQDPTTGAYECCQACDYTGKAHSISLDWVVVGGESGPGARPMHPKWATDLRDECAGLEVPFLFKQWGAWGPFDSQELLAYRDAGHAMPETVCLFSSPAHQCGEQRHMWLRGKHETGRLLDGQLHDQYPEREAA